MEPDPHAAGLPGDRYTLVSLYLDTPSLDFYLDTVQGEKNRHKLRLRKYLERPDGIVFFEVKSKVDDVIRKRRARVRLEAVDELLRGAPPRRSHLARGGTSELVDLMVFLDLMEMGSATPRMRVRYTREAWVGRADPGLRITFDRQLECSPTDSTDVIGAADEWFRASQPPVILEIKFDDQYPAWVSDLVRRFGLTRTSVPKYVLSTDAVDRHGGGVGETLRRVIR